MGKKNKLKRRLNDFYLEEIDIKEEREVKYTVPKNESQERYVEQLHQYENRIIIATGPAGTGKTLFATEIGVKYFLEKKFDKIIFVRPVVSVDEEIGFLPGKLEEKMAPWIRPIYDILYRFILPKEVEHLIEQKKIEIVPLAFMRGRTFKNTWIIADEMQNSTISQMKMLLTRLGEKSRMVITGDLEQNDLGMKVNGLEDFLEKFKGRRSNSISSIEFNRSDVEREKVVREVLDIYSGNKIPDCYIDMSEEHVDYDIPNMIDISDKIEIPNIDEICDSIDDILDVFSEIDENNETNKTNVIHIEKVIYTSK